MISISIFHVLLICYVILVNIAGFVMMWSDKRRAIKGAWRLSEASLFVTAAIGGSIGCIAGMQIFRHKTKHWYFKYGMPAILLVQLVLILVLI
ncbi:MAG: DUF1294 domain-containing protein [Lachnospiraceae bacterium]|nr:DUF1294 domain-containing protein [Lachnospiraceae bacterium]